MNSHKGIATTSVGVIEEVELPTPEPGPGELLVEMKYAALSPVDSYQLYGAFHVEVYPHILGHAGAGIVRTAGEGVTDIKEGDRVSTEQSVMYIKLLMLLNLYSDRLQPLRMVDRARNHCRNTASSPELSQQRLGLGLHHTNTWC